MSQAVKRFDVANIAHRGFGLIVLGFNISLYTTKLQN